MDNYLVPPLFIKVSLNRGWYINTEFISWVINLANRVNSVTLDIKLMERASIDKKVNTKALIQLFTDLNNASQSVIKSKDGVVSLAYKNKTKSKPLGVRSEILNEYYGLFKISDAVTQLQNAVEQGILPRFDTDSLVHASDSDIQGPGSARAVSFY